MRVVVQRVSKAEVWVDGNSVGYIEKGLLILLGIEQKDTEEDIDWLCGKILCMRIFPDEAGSMNVSLAEAGGDILLVSQFTLFASIKKGNRPSFIRAAPPEMAIPLYTKFIAALETGSGKKIQTGIFGANMQVQSINEGPVTIIADSKNRE